MNVLRNARKEGLARLHHCTPTQKYATCQETGWNTILSTMPIIDMHSERGILVIKTQFSPSSIVMPFSGKFCPSGVISFIFEIKGKTLPNEGKITD